MVSARIHRQVTFWTRVFSCFITGASLVFFSIILTYVLDDRFPAQEQGYSVLPVGSLAFLLLWNVFAIATHRLPVLVRFVHRFGDLVGLLLLSVLAPPGFAHDDRTYLSNGLYQQYETDNWLKMAIVGGSLGIVSIIIQMFLITWSFTKPAKVSVEIEEPPAYFETHDDIVKQDRKEKELLDWHSTSSQYFGTPDRR